MFSICIPIYNYYVGDLAGALYAQAAGTGLAFEILLADDASEDIFRQRNAAIALPHLRYIQLEENTGRSRIRNLLGREAQYSYLIFMDCDSAVPSEDYIKRYVPYFKPGVLCSGGRVYGQERERGKKYLRWKYGVYRECLDAERRESNPCFGFMSCNFLIYKPLLEDNPFSEDLSGYGHEDTLFGIELREKGVSLLHIDNPLVHLGLEDSDVFIGKTEKALSNLRKIDRLLKEKHPRHAVHSSLIRMEARLRRMRLLPLFSLAFTIIKPLIKTNLCGPHPSLFLFDIYKLGILAGLRDTDSPA
ncbi:MAG: glycosyltransferase [Tannerellaceae bacterium]|jgi:glycosyltransferase involved in cell wall biosynthesis|nr:glycosyltransferase [Tannerellaceae bacterium]